MVDTANPAPRGGLAGYLGRLIGLRRGKGLRFWEVLSIFAFALGLAYIAVYGAASGHFATVFGILSLVGGAAWLAGGVLGFLFGVPRLRATSSQMGPISGASTFVPNTNLEQISDWLTKAIVGATLVQIRPLSNAFTQLAASIGAGLGAPGSSTAAAAVMTLYFAGGFMWGYLWCSLRIFEEMSALVDRENALTRKEASGTDQSAR
jgi:hypothetical protein